MAKRKNIISKGIHTYKRRGMKALARKSVDYSTYQVKRVAAPLIPPRLRSAFYVKDDEYYFVTNPVFQIDSKDIEKSNQAITKGPLKSINTATWFVPFFDHLKFGGIYTIFRFISYMATQGVENRIVIYDNPTINKDKLQQEIVDTFPELQDSEIIIYDAATMSVNDLPASDIAFCTFWVSAYLLLKFNKTKKKYYFIQDYEPLFYPGGATYALAESTYRFGFKGVVNTPGLLAATNQRHGLEGVSFVPAVDRSLYNPDTKEHKGPVRIFFYARPNNPRNAFNLGTEIIKMLKKKYKNKVKIITAGAEWKERAYGMKGLVENRGLLKSLEEVAELYRSCDIGFVYMLSKHPSYQPFEFMASGMATVSNYNEDNLWFLRDGENCLLAEPSPKAMVEQISRLIDDKALRKRIVKNGLKSVENEWSWQTDTIWNEIKNT